MDTLPAYDSADPASSPCSDTAFPITLGKSFSHSVPQFPICDMVIVLLPYLTGVLCEDKYIEDCDGGHTNTLEQG